MRLLYVFLIIIFLLSLRIIIKINLKYDLLGNIGNITIKLFNFIPIINLRISLIGFYFNLVNKKNKVIQIKLDINDKNLVFIEALQKNLSKKIYLLGFENNSVIGFENPFYASISYSFYERIMDLIFLKLFLSDSDTVINDNSFIVYFQNELILDFSGTIMLSIFDILWAVTQALFSRSYVDYGRKKSKSWFNNWLYIKKS